MGKYLLTWEIKKEFVPSELDKHDKMVDMLSFMVKRGFESGYFRDWGVFAKKEGYVIFEGEFIELSLNLILTAPLIELREIRQVLKLDESDKFQKEAIKAIQKT